MMVRDACSINIRNDTPRSVIDDSRVTLKSVASLIIVTYYKHFWSKFTHSFCKLYPSRVTEKCFIYKMVWLYKKGE